MTRIDPSRLRLKHYAVDVRDGLMFIGLGGALGSSRPAGGILPAWLANAAVSRRARWSTTWNWKFALQFIKGSPQLFLDDVDERDSWHVLAGSVSSLHSAAARPSCR